MTLLLRSLRCEPEIMNLVRETKTFELVSLEAAQNLHKVQETFTKCITEYIYRKYLCSFPTGPSGSIPEFVHRHLSSRPGSLPWHAAEFKQQT